LPSLRLLAVLMIAALAPARAATMYCCTDDRGHRSCGDTLPQICYGRAYREIVDGIPHEVLPTPTPDQRAKRDADAKAKRDADRAALLEKRRNQALLDSYTSVADIDFMRDHAVAGIAREIKQAQDKYDAAAKRKQDVAKEPPSEERNAQIRASEDELQGQKRLIDSKQQEMDDVKAKFEAQKLRYLELTRKPIRDTGAADAAKPH